MATIYIFCKCKIKELGIAKIDLYTDVPCDTAIELLKGIAKCRHCGKKLKHVSYKRYKKYLKRDIKRKMKIDSLESLLKGGK